MKCLYPNCYSPALFTPVIELPTIRTAGDKMVETTEPTVLLGQPVCQAHRDRYNLTEWIKPGDWAALRDLARERGLTIPRPDLIVVRFKPLGWTPKRTLELERS